MRFATSTSARRVAGAVRRLASAVLGTAIVTAAPPPRRPAAAHRVGAGRRPPRSTPAR